LRGFFATETQRHEEKFSHELTRIGTNLLSHEKAQKKLATEHTENAEKKKEILPRRHEDTKKTQLLAAKKHRRRKELLTAEGTENAEKNLATN